MQASVPARRRWVDGRISHHTAGSARWIHAHSCRVRSGPPALNSTPSGLSSTSLTGQLDPRRSPVTYWQYPAVVMGIFVALMLLEWIMASKKHGKPEFSADN